MLVHTSYKRDKPSIFKCDRCGILMDMGEVHRYNINIATNSKESNIMKNIKTYHLCVKCAKALVNGIEKGVKNDKNN